MIPGMKPKQTAQGPGTKKSKHRDPRPDGRGHSARTKKGTRPARNPNRKRQYLGTWILDQIYLVRADFYNCC